MRCCKTFMHNAVRDLRENRKKKTADFVRNQRFYGCGDRTRTCDLRVMSPTSYQLLYSAISTKMVPVTGLEPVQHHCREILSLLCLPFHHTGSFSAMNRIPQCTRFCQGFVKKLFDGFRPLLPGRVKKSRSAHIAGRPKRVGYWKASVIMIHLPARHVNRSFWRMGSCFAGRRQLNIL